MNRLVFSLCLVALAGGADWTQFRGPGGTGVSDEKGLPVEWSLRRDKGSDKVAESKNVRWTADLPGRGLASPIVVGNRVFVTACSGYLQTRLHVLCFDALSGKKLWERQFWATGGTACHPKTNMAAPTPATDGQRIYALFATCDLICIDLDGNLVWLRTLCRDYPTATNQVGMASSPVLAGNSVVVQLETGGESFAAGIDKLTGKNRWKVERTRNINWVTPVVLAGGKQVVLQSGEGLTALDAISGAKLWQYEGKFSTIPSTTAGNGAIFAPGDGLTALKPPDASGKPEVLWTSNRLRCATASPVFSHDRLYALNSTGVLACAEAATGKVLWQERLKGPFSASPVIGDGKLYATNEAGATFVLQLGEKPAIAATNEIGDTILGSPAISGGAIFLRSDKHLYCVAGKK